MKERLRDQDNITFIIPRDPVYVYDVSNVRNIIAHGEEMSKKSLPHVVMEYGDTNMYNVVKYGHLHFTHIKETSDKGMML
jgi:predicted phosphodiesterase